MLNSNKVLNYVKSNLGFPFMHLEWSDDEILSYIKDYTIAEFSHYFPEVKTMGLNLTLESNQVPCKDNEYYLIEPQGREILNVVAVYFSESDYIFFGHPPLGPLSVGEVRSWALDVEMSMMVKQFSSYDKTFEFKHPNIIRISPTTSSITWCGVEYERKQSEDFSGIPNDIQMFFLELALSDIMITIGRIRKRYGGGNLRTPFGEIPLESDIYEEGKEKKREVLEKLTTGSLPNVLVDFG